MLTWVELKPNHEAPNRGASELSPPYELFVGHFPRGPVGGGTFLELESSWSCTAFLPPVNHISIKKWIKKLWNSETHFKICILFSKTEKIKTSKHHSYFESWHTAYRKTYRQWIEGSYSSLLTPIPFTFKM